MQLAKWHILVLFLILTSFQGRDRSLTDFSELNPCSTENNVFVEGEKMVYKIYYNWNFIWIAAGEVTFQVKEKDHQYHLSAMGRTFDSYDWIFKVRDYYDSYVAKADLRPLRTIRKVHEGNYRLYDDVTYIHDQSMAVSRKGKSEDDLEEAQVSLESCTHDLLSSVYMMRNIDFQSLPEGTVLPLNVYLDREIYDIDVVYEGIDPEKKVKGLGKCNTMLFKPRLIVGNIFKDNEGMSVWVSNDENRIPLLIESPISVGSVKVVLKEYKGLKYEADFDLK